MAVECVDCNASYVAFFPFVVFWKHNMLVGSKSTDMVNQKLCYLLCDVDCILVSKFTSANFTHKYTPRTVYAIHSGVQSFYFIVSFIHRINVLGEIWM